MKKYEDFVMGCLKYGAIFGLLAAIIFSLPRVHKNFLQMAAGGKSVTLHGKRGSGSGSFVETKLGVHILTNAHVCELADASGHILVKYPDNSINRRKIIKIYEDHDLCLVSGTDRFGALKLASNVKVGDYIAIVGHPAMRPLILSEGEFIGSEIIQLVNGVNLEPKDCKGEVEEAPPFLGVFGIFSFCVVSLQANQTFAYSQPGSSGSPVVNYHGNLVGVHFAGNRQDSTHGFNVPLEYVKDFLENL